MLGMFWKRTTGAAAIVGVLSGFLLSVFFNDFAPNLSAAKPALHGLSDTGKLAEDGGNESTRFPT